MRIDLNCDLGEGAGNDEALMPLITSANVACGGHAGDEATMRHTVALAERCGVAIGAHPGFEDRAHFGRRDIAMEPDAVERMVRTQVERLAAITKLRHVKPHGALYNMAARDAAMAAAIARAVKSVNAGLILVGLAGSEMLLAGERAGLRVASEVFADRRYESNGSLTPRGRPDAMIEDDQQAVEQVLSMIMRGAVRAIDGSEVRVRADTVCVHGDGARAVDFARALRQALLSAGIELRPL